jgi:hypothetical protein
MDRSISEGIFTADHVAIRSTTIEVLRDKTLKDGPQPYRPLLGSLFRDLPPGTGVDTIVVQNLDVAYHEQVDRGRGFARIPFHGIAAQVIGARNDQAYEKCELRVQAECYVFEKTPV